MIIIRTLNEDCSNRELMDNMSNRVKDMKRLLTLTPDKYNDESIKRMMSVHVEWLEEEINILSKRFL